MFIKTQGKATVVNTERVSNIRLGYESTEILAELADGQIVLLGDYPEGNVMDALERLLSAISEDRSYYEM